MTEDWHLSATFVFLPWSSRFVSMLSLSSSSSSSLCCVVVVMCGGFCAGWQGVFVFLTCDSCQLEFYMAVAWYNICE